MLFCSNLQAVQSLRSGQIVRWRAEGVRAAEDDGPIIAYHARSPRQLEEALRDNMVFIFKPSVRSADGNSVCTWGDTVVIT